METVTIISPAGRTAARFVPGAGLVCESLVHDNDELLDQGHGLQAYAQRGKTMGIPLLYPWANRLHARTYDAAGKSVTLPDPDGRYALDPAGLPIHGALPGLMQWDVIEAGADRLHAVLRWHDEALLSIFPYRHSVELQAAVSEGDLRLQTTVVADGEQAVPVAFGYHPYLTLPGSDRSGWQVDLGASSRLALDDRMIPTGERTELHERDFLLADSSWDDGLADLSTPAQFLVGDGERELSVTFEQGYDWAQVYAPPGQDFICFEPMTAPTDALSSGTGLHIVAPGETYAAAFTISVAP
jgi:aldose 1-epimerase